MVSLSLLPRGEVGRCHRGGHVAGADPARAAGGAEDLQPGPVGRLEAGQRHRLVGGQLAHERPARRAADVQPRAARAGHRGRGRAAGRGHRAAGDGRPGQGHRRPAGVVVILHLDCHRPGQGHGGEEAAVGLVAPLVDQNGVVGPQPHAVIAEDLEAVRAAGEIDRPRPAHREAVSADAGDGRAQAPVEVDRVIDARGRRRAAEGHVVVIFAEPGAGDRWAGDAPRAAAAAAGDGTAARRVPAQGHRRPAVVLEVLQAQRRGPIESHANIEAPVGLVAPFVNDQRVVDPQPHAVIAEYVKAIGAGREVERPRPAHREAVGGDARRGRAGAPVEIDGRVVAHHGRAAAQVHIVEIFAAPVADDRRAAARHLNPVEPGDGHAARLVILHADVVVAGRQGAVGGDGAHLAIVPGVDEQLVIDPHPHPIVHRGRETVGAGVEIDDAVPAGREVVVGDERRVGAAAAPIVVDGVLIALPDSIAGQIAVVPVAGAPLGIGGSRVGRGHRQQPQRQQPYQGYQRNEKFTVHGLTVLLPRPPPHQRQQKATRRAAGTVLFHYKRGKGQINRRRRKYTRFYIPFSAAAQVAACRRQGKANT
ncbi:protein of unknown function [Candidatus Promineifilum breve]|uniref:Uncharacterized protein n=1 Tax=Candidatus Promineifilum breve TaxID=1806508 RepID=A0A170PJG0_9CHLR|nr:protein of unknown function [Candidatus Promineifilum breve]